VQSAEYGIFAHLDPSSLTSSGLERRTALALYLFSRSKVGMHGVLCGEGVMPTSRVIRLRVKSLDASILHLGPRVHHCGWPIVGRGRVAGMFAASVIATVLVVAPVMSPQLSRAQESTARPILYFDIDKSTNEPVTSAVYPNGRQVKALVRALAAWSPDGTWFAYAAKAADGRDVLKLGNLSGGEKILFTTGGDKTILPFPAWSPDSGRLAVIAEQRGQGGILLANSLVIIGVADGKVLSRYRISDRTILPFLPLNKFRWSPDGHKILISWENVIVIDAETGRSETINPDPAIAEWAPDSSGIYYFPVPPTSRSIALSELYLRKLGGNSVKLIDEKGIQALGLTFSPFIYGRMNLAPSGKWLAVAIGSTKSQAGVLLVYDVTAGRTGTFEKPSKIIEPRSLIIALDWAPAESSVAALTVSSQVKVEALNLNTEEWKTLATVVETSQVDSLTLAFGWVSWTR
jgi:hypothetical protein